MEGSTPLVTITIWCVKVGKLPHGNTQAQAAFHTGNNGVLTVVPAAEASPYDTSVSSYLRFLLGTETCLGSSTCYRRTYNLPYIYHVPSSMAMACCLA